VSNVEASFQPILAASDRDPANHSSTFCAVAFTCLRALELPPKDDQLQNEGVAL